MSRELSPRQAEFLEFIQAEIGRKQRAPTVRELCARFGINSPNGVMCHLRALEKKGYIQRDGYLSRGIRVVGMERNCPHCGKDL